MIPFEVTPPVELNQTREITCTIKDEGCKIDLQALLRLMEKDFEYFLNLRGVGFGGVESNITQEEMIRELEPLYKLAEELETGSLIKGLQIIDEEIHEEIQIVIGMITYSRALHGIENLFDYSKENAPLNPDSVPSIQGMLNLQYHLRTGFSITDKYPTSETYTTSQILDTYHCLGLLESDV